jgi:hypothetical protein
MGGEHTLGLNESGSPEHTLYWSRNLIFNTVINLYLSSQSYPLRLSYSLTLTVKHFSVLCLLFNNCPPSLPVNHFGSANSIVCRLVHLHLCTPICPELTDHTRLPTFQQPFSTDPSTQLTVSLYKFPQWAQNTIRKMTPDSEGSNTCSTCTFIFSEMPINLCRS